MLALPMACVSWTVTHEEVFREPREFCKDGAGAMQAGGDAEILLPVHMRVLLFALCDAVLPAITRFTLLYAGWRGYLISWFALVWVANVYMSVFNRLRLEIKHENVKIATDQVVKEKVEGSL